MKLIRFSVDDWEAIYDANTGKIIDQGHSLNLTEVLRKLGHQVESNYMDDPNNLDEFGNRFPDSLEKIVDYSNRKGQ